MHSDLIRLALDIEPSEFSAVIDQLGETAHHFQYKFFKQAVGPELRWTMPMSIDGEHLDVKVYCVYKSRRIEFKFKGEINFPAFQEKLVLLHKYGLANALLHGMVRRFELAMNVYGVRAKDYLWYRNGVHGGEVVVNKAGDGWSYYLGSRNGQCQYIIYDKAKELRDKGIAHLPGELLRIECRILRRTECLSELVKSLYSSNPFSGFYAAPKSALLKLQTKLNNWGHLVNLCSVEGVPTVAAGFPHHKKTLLNEIKANAHPTLTPKLTAFEGTFCRLLEASTSISCPV